MGGQATSCPCCTTSSSTLLAGLLRCELLPSVSSACPLAHLGQVSQLLNLPRLVFSFSRAPDVRHRGSSGTCRGRSQTGEHSLVSFSTSRCECAFITRRQAPAPKWTTPCGRRSPSSASGSLKRSVEATRARLSFRAPEPSESLPRSKAWRWLAAVLRTTPLSSSILAHIAADWSEFADIWAAARPLSQKSQ